MPTRTRKFLIVFLGAIGILAALLTGAYLYLPHYVETRLIPDLARTAGFRAESVTVDHIGFSSAELGPLQLSGSQGPALALERLHLSYSPATLLHRRIGKVRLEGLKAALRIADGELFLGDIRIAPEEPAQTDPQASPAVIPALPFRHLEVRDALLEIAWQARRLSIPLNLTVDATAADQGRWSAEAVLTPRQSQFRATAELETAGKLTLELTHAQTMLEAWRDLLPPEFGFLIEGRLEATGSALLRMDPLRIEAAGAEIGLVQFAAAPSTSDSTRSGQATPLNVRLNAHTSLSGTQTAKGWSGRYTIDVRNLDLKHARSTLVSPHWRLTGEAELDQELRIDLQSTGSELSIAHEAITLTIPRTALQASAQYATGGLRAQGRAEISGAALADSARKLTAGDIDIELPFEWPAPESTAAGHISIGRITFQQKALGDLAGLLRQTGRSLHFDLTHHSQLLEDLIVRITGNADDNQAVADIAVPEYQPATPIALGRFAPDAGNLLLSGRFEARSRLRWTPDATQASATVRIDEGSLHDAERDLELTGIRAQLQLDDALAPHSPPGQRLQVARIKFGKIKAANMDMQYHITPPQRLLIESAKVDWCGGRIKSGPLELSADSPAIETVITVRDLNLAEMLGQLDLAEGSGQGTLRGRIPIRWAKGQLTFGKSSLSSPPGQSGVIRLKELPGTQDLLNTLPAETPQHTQLDIAMEALKDYTYRSIDLQLETQGETLVMQLQLDGKPNRLMPFAYDQALGRLKRVQGEGQAEFQGIDIDLNFRSPLNEILNYRDLLKTP